MKQERQNINLDATLLKAGMVGNFVPCSIALGLKPEEAFGRAEWFKKQPKSYQQKVINKVIKMEKTKEQKGESK